MKKTWPFLLYIGILSVFIIFWGLNSQEEPEASSTVFYVPNAGDGTISVIDPVKGETIDSISLGTNQASHGIALSPDGKTLFAGTGFEGKSLVAINTDTKKVIKDIKFEDGVHGIDISGDGQYLYLTLMNGLGKGDGTLAVFNTANMEKIAEVNTGGGPAHVAVKPDGSQVWVANVNGNSVAVFDAKNNQMIKTISVGEVPNEVAISPDGKWAFVANVNSDLITVIDANELETVKTITAGKAPHGVTVSPDGSELWVANNKSNDVSIIDIETFTLKATIPTGAYANHVAFSPDGKWAYVTNRQSNDVVKMDTNKKEVVANIPVGVEPHEITLEDYYGKAESVKTTSSQAKESAGSSSATEATNKETNQEIKTTQVEGIEVEVIRLEPDESKVNSSIDFETFDVFQLSLTTHSGDLSSLKLEENIFLSSSSGNKIGPAQWIVNSADSHHPQFLALFSKENEDSSDRVSLEIGGIGNEPIKLEWDTSTDEG